MAKLEDGIPQVVQYCVTSLAESDFSRVSAAENGADAPRDKASTTTPAWNPKRSRAEDDDDDAPDDDDVDFVPTLHQKQQHKKGLIGPHTLSHFISNYLDCKPFNTGNKPVWEGYMQNKVSEPCQTTRTKSQHCGEHFTNRVDTPRKVSLLFIVTVNYRAKVSRDTHCIFSEGCEERMRHRARKGYAEYPCLR